MSAPSNKRGSSSPTRSGKKRKEPGARPRNKGVPKSHAVTFMTPELEVVRRKPVEVAVPKKVYEKPDYGSRSVIKERSLVLAVETDPGILKQPILKSMNNVHNILSYIDWKVKLYWFHAGTPSFIKEYWDNRGPLVFPEEGSINHPRVLSLQRFKDKLATRIQSLFRGARLRMTIQARLDHEKLHKRYRKLQFVHPQPKCICFIHLNPCNRWKYRHKIDEGSLSTVLSTGSVDTSLGFIQCPVCAALVLQVAYRKRKVELQVEGVVQFTWYDPSLSANQRKQTPIMRAWTCERLALRARITEFNATLWEEKIKRFRGDKKNHSYAVEEHYREIYLRRQSESLRLVDVWKEQIQLTSFAELEKQRDVEGRGEGSDAAAAAAASVSSKKGRKRRGGQNMIQKMKKMKKMKNEENNGFSKRDREKERKALVLKIRKDALLEEEASQSSIDKRAQFEAKKLEAIKQKRKSQLHQHIERNADGENTDAQQEETEEANLKTEEETKNENELVVKEVELLVKYMIDAIVEKYQRITHLSITKEEKSLEEKTDEPIKKKKISKKKRILGSPEQEAAREARIRKNEDAKILSYIRRLNLKSYIGDDGLRHGAATIAQSVFRMASARIFAAKKRLIRATRLKRVKRQYWFLRDKQWETGWAFLLGEYHRFRREAAQRIQGAFRASVAKGIVQKARRWKAIHMLQPWWRGTWARMFTVANLKQQRRVEQLTRRVMARMKYSGLLYTLHTWHANVVEIKLNRDRLFLLRQIADQKWVRCCAIRIQASWRRFYYTQINGAHHIHSVEFSPASLRIQKLRKQLHPRLVQLVSQLEKTGNADEFAIDLLGSVEMWQNPEQSIILASKIELGNRIPLEPLPLQKMQEWIENTMKRTLLWRPQPLDCIGFTDKDEGPHDHQACRCNPFARVSLHRAGFCRGKIGLPHVIWFPFIHVVQKYFQAVEKMREIQRDVVQALQEKRMMETLGCLILADTSDRGNRFGHTHTRWSKKSVITRSRMNNRALKRDNKQHDYIRWFVKDVDTCAKCNALLSWKAANGKCQVCNTSRLQAPTMSSTLQSKLLLPPLGSRRGVKSRKGLSGVGDIEESINELIYHASFCCYAPAGHWRRLMPKWKVWEESRIHLAEPTRKVLLIYNISTIGSLWLSKISGQLESIPELNDEIVQKLCRLMEFLSDYIMGELLAPEDDQEMYNEKYGRDLVNEFRERRVGYYENP